MYLKRKEFVVVKSKGERKGKKPSKLGGMGIGVDLEGGGRGGG